MTHPDFPLRPGVAMSDWSLVTDPTGRDALAASMEAAGRAEKWSGLDATEDSVWRAALRALARCGPAPDAAGLVAATGLAEAEVSATLRSLLRCDLVVLDADEIGVTAAYPFCTWTTGHRVELAGWGEAECPCAIDALGAGAMLGCDAVVTSRCAEYGAAVRVMLSEQGRVLGSVEPPGALVWSGIRYAGNCGATSGCRTKVFACSDAHLQAWRARAAAGVPGFRLTMAAALQVGTALLVPMLAPNASHCDSNGDDSSTSSIVAEGPDMNCCERLDGLTPGGESLLDRRAALRGLAGAAGGLAMAGSARAQGTGKLRLAFCGQLLCVVPYEVAKARGHFREQGLDIDLVYTRGGNQAMQALVGGAVDYAGTSFDVALQAFANGAMIRRFASTGRLPLFALATAPGKAAEIQGIGALLNRTVGVSGLGNADHAIMLFLLRKEGVDPARVRFAAIGTNLFEALRRGQVDAGMVQEPALTLLTEAGGRVIFNAMDLDDATRRLGGAYEFMGVAVRADERDRRLDEMRRLSRALAAGLRDTRTIPIEEVVAALPRELVAGGDQGRLGIMLERYRLSLYPDDVRIDPAAARRVEEASRVAGLLTKDVDLGVLLDRAVLES